jgi:hypothetical protein
MYTIGVTWMVVLEWLEILSKGFFFPILECNEYVKYEQWQENSSCKMKKSYSPKQEDQRAY